jgi:hypothetical protein
MSGGLFANQLLRETGIEINDERVRRLCDAHAAAYLKTADPTRTPVVPTTRSNTPSPTRIPPRW